MPEVWCVRAEGGRYTEDFVKGGYAGIGWELGDLSRVKSRDELERLYRKNYPDHNALTVGQNVGQIWRFATEMTEGEYVVTPGSDRELLWWGEIGEKTYYYLEDGDSCPYSHRKSVKWNKDPVRRSSFSVPFQNSIKSSLTVFWIVHKDNFLEVIGRRGKKKPIPPVHVSADRVVLDKILELDASEFEMLVIDLLTTLGFEATQHTGGSGDEGVDAEGEMDLFGMASVKLYVQAKRYKLDSKIGRKDVLKLRQKIESGAQGAIVATCGFTDDALSAAVETGFPRIGTINGSQLVDILSQKWDELPEEIREKLGLKRSLELT